MSSSSKDAARGPNTRLVALGRSPSEQYGFVNTPVYHGSTVLYDSADDLFANRIRYSYGRRHSPTIDALTSAMTDLEGAAGTVLAPSGLAAVTTGILAAVSAGDHMLVADSVYHPMRHFCDGLLKRLGVEVTYYDPLIGGGISELMQPNTRAVFTESPGSLTFEVQDIPAIAEAAHAAGALVLLDNTWATPLYFDALAHGVDISIQAGTKYVSGHADVLIGSVSANKDAWPRLRDTHGDLGLSVGPDDIYLALRGLRTMGVRLARHHQSGVEVARWLKERPEIARVMHPALEDDPGHALWKRDFTGACGLFGIELRPVGREQVKTFLDTLSLFGMGYSWGGFESLIVPFDTSKGRTLPSPFEGPTFRIHIGLEDVSDLTADLDAALNTLSA
jgi:cysteine-S-conjugate beta-lyase